MGMLQVCSEKKAGIALFSLLLTKAIWQGRLPALLFAIHFQPEAKAKRRQIVSLKKQLSWCRQTF